MLIHEDRLFPAEAGTRKIARALYAHVKGLPIVSPHGHTQAALVCEERAFSRPGEALCAARSLRLPHALTARAFSMEDLEIGAAGDEGSAQGLAHLCQPLLSVSRNAHAHVAGFCLSGAFWTGGAAV
jgi:hypothetical protein